MSNLTANGRNTIEEIARRYGLSSGAVEHMARAVSNGGGTMAQFNVPELGGSGQWMAGGMTMVGDMFNSGLQNTVSNLCGELSNAMASTLFFEQPKTTMGGGSWPEWLGQPAASGGQNQARYAYFPQARRLAFDHGNGGALVLLDTGDHQISGISQQQSGLSDPFGGVSVSSQFGQFALSSFPVVDQNSQGEPTMSAPPAPAGNPDFGPEPTNMPFDTQGQDTASNQAPAQPPVNTDDILGTIARLAQLRDAGALSEEEFSTKKSELLARL